MDLLDEAGRAAEALGRVINVDLVRTAGELRDVIHVAVGPLHSAHEPIDLVLLLLVDQDRRRLVVHDGPRGELRFAHPGVHAPEGAQ